MWAGSEFVPNKLLKWEIEAPKCSGGKGEKVLLFAFVQFSSVVQSCLTLCYPMDCSTPGLPVITNSQSLLKRMSIESVMPSNHLILCHPLLQPSNFLSIRFFSNESDLRMRWPKYWSFSFNISPSSEHPGLISFWMDWLDLLAVQGTLKSLLQHHSSKASILGAQLFGPTLRLYHRVFYGLWVICMLHAKKVL